MGDKDEVAKKSSKEWPGIAEKRILCGKLAVKRFAFALPSDVPGDLLAFVASTLPAEMRQRQLKKQMHKNANLL